MNVRRMLQEISSYELLEWEAFAELEPFDEERADARTGAIRSTLVNINRGRNTSPVSTLEMTPIFGDGVKPEPPPKSWQEMKAIGKSIAMLYGAGDKKRGNA